jgi:hypothetical protein
MPGQPSKLNSWPWIAAVGYSNPDIPGAVDYLCGGTLVTSRYALVSGGVFLRRQCHEIFVFCFVHQTTFPGLSGMSRNDFKFSRIFMELFVFVIVSTVMSIPGSQLESLR